MSAIGTCFEDYFTDELFFGAYDVTSFPGRRTSTSRCHRHGGSASPRFRCSSTSALSGTRNAHVTLTFRAADFVLDLVNGLEDLVSHAIEYREVRKVKGREIGAAS